MRKEKNCLNKTGKKFEILRTSPSLWMCVIRLGLTSITNILLLLVVQKNARKWKNIHSLFSSKDMIHCIAISVNLLLSKAAFDEKIK